MGSVVSKNLQDVTVAEVQVHVAKMGNRFLAYVQPIADIGVDGEMLYNMRDVNELKRILKLDFHIESPGITKKLVQEWEKAMAQQAKRQKIMDEKGEKAETVQLTNTDLFFAPSEVPKPQHEEEKKLVPFIGAAWLEETLELLLEQKEMDDKNGRPLPLALVRCSRGGKTRSMKELVYKIKPEDASAIYLSFNNESSISSQTYWKSSVQELCDRIGFAARKGKLGELNWLRFRDTYHVDSESIKDWLGQENCILFVDELNLLSSVSTDVANLLKGSFLSSKGRSFCFSSHLASTSHALASFVPDESNREIILRKLPLVSEMGEARRKLNCPRLSEREALYYGLIPGLLVERAQDHTVTNRRAKAVRFYVHQLNLLGQNEAREACCDLFKSFVTGSVSSVPVELQELMTAEQTENDVILHWIPCHLEYLLKEMWQNCKKLPNRECMARIYEHLFNYLGSKTGSGDAFEHLFIVVIIIRCLSATLESKVLPLLDVGEDVVVKCDTPFLGKNFNTEEDPEAFVAEIPMKLQDQGCDQISIYYPGHAKFQAYDVIVAFWKVGQPRKLYGYQLKEGADVGKPFAYDNLFAASYLIRGAATKSAHSVRLFMSCSEEQLDSFFGVSGNQWTPKAWKELHMKKEE